MKSFSIVFLLMNILPFASCQTYPAKMPLDFSIGIGSYGGMTGLSGRTIISLDFCLVEEKLVDRILTRYEWKVTEAELEPLYQSLRKLNAFDIKWLAYHGREYDSGNTSVIFTVSKKNYRILESANNRVISKHVSRYRVMLKLIQDFADSFSRKNENN